MYSVVEIDRPDDAPLKTFTLGVAQTPVGSALLVWDEIGVRELNFDQNPIDAMDSLMKSGVPFARDDNKAAALLSDVFNGLVPELPLVLCGTPFQRRVWRELMRLALGQTVSYGELAARIGKPSAARAVGSAVGANVLGFVVPCHRVIRQDGVVGQFRWGADVKRRLLAWEAGRIDE